MEKIKVGLSMCTRWTDPPIVILTGVVGSILLALITSILLTYYYGITTAATTAIITLITAKVFYEFVYLRTEEAPTSKYIEFKDNSLKRKFSNRRIPISILYENYIRGKLDFKVDVLQALWKRDEYVSYRLTGEYF
jgi:hypothetical protein